ncbi:hypothetical protein ON010_g17670 [Phytophthora cinnamomi]|nr:hypothetical protein ON010_g17670 [Phytophthora cinnamomi]
MRPGPYLSIVTAAVSLLLLPNSTVEQQLTAEYCRHEVCRSGASQLDLVETSQSFATTIMPSEAKESKDGDVNSDAKRSRAAFDVDEDETVLPDDAKKPPMRASIGWGNETTLASEEKDGGGTPDPDTTPAATGASTSESKRVGRRRKGSEATGSSSGDRRNQKNRYFEEDDETTDIMEIPDLEEEEREPDITTMGQHLCTIVSEEDEPWDFDTLLNDIAQEIQKDLDEKEELVRLGSQDSLHLAP